MNTKKYLSIYFLLFSICLISCADKELTKSVNAKSDVVQLNEISHSDQLSTTKLYEIEMQAIVHRIASLERRVRTLEKNSQHKYRPIDKSPGAVQ